VCERILIRFLPSFFVFIFIEIRLRFIRILFFIMAIIDINAYKYMTELTYLTY